MPEGVDEVVLIGERLSIERVGGTEVVTAPGRPYAVVSEVEIEYRPARRRAPARGSPLTPQHGPSQALSITLRAPVGSVRR